MYLKFASKEEVLQSFYMFLFWHTFFEIKRMLNRVDSQEQT
jgi:hypothetical protein